MLLQATVRLSEQRYGFIVIFAEGMFTQSRTTDYVRCRDTRKDVQIDGRVRHVVGNQHRGIVELVGLLEPARSELLRALPRSSAHWSTRARAQSAAVP